MNRFRYQLLALALCLVASRSASGAYGHRFIWLKPIDEAKLASCIADMQRVTAISDQLLAGPDGEGPIATSPTRIEFNGKGPDAKQPFAFPGHATGVNSCKTQSKPYDAVVTACLIVARDHFSAKELAIVSDGQWAEGDWKDGAKLYRKVFQRSATDPINVEMDGDDLPIGEGQPQWPGAEPEWGPVSTLVLIAMAVGAAWLILQPHFSLVVEIVNSKVERVRGNGKRKMLLDVDDTCRASEIRHGWIRELNIRGWRKLFISGDISVECRQRIRNIYTAYKLDPRG